MRSFPIFAVLFLVVPIIEIFFLIQVGEIIGAWKTIFLVVLTAVIGAFLLRQQGLSTLARLQNNMSQGKIPAQELIEGVLLAVGGALLMTPGFVTDTIGFLCLLPFSRQFLASHIMKRSANSMHSRMGGFTQGGFSQSGFYSSQTEQQNDNGDVLDGEFTEIHEDAAQITQEKSKDS